MNRPDEQDVIGARPAKAPADLGPLFAGAADVAAAEAEIRRDFVEPEPAPAPRAKEESGNLAPVSEKERAALRDRVKGQIRGPLLELARQRRNTSDEKRIGVIAQDARQIADRKGLHGILGDEQRAWSWMAKWLDELVREGLLVKYHIAGMVVKRMNDQGNDQVIYLDPYDHRARTAA